MRRKLVVLPAKVPVKMHWGITTRCNLSCPECFYRSDVNCEISYAKAVSLVHEWHDAGVDSVAIGGGEPMVVEWLGDLVEEIKRLGMYCAVTTNGSRFRHDVRPSSIAVSYDEIHGQTWMVPSIPDWWRRFCVENSIDFGVNHIVTSRDALMEALRFLKDEKRLVLIMKKPKSRFTTWKSIDSIIRSHAVDACLAKTVYGKHCYQGEISMYLGPDMMAKVCSNVPEKIEYTDLASTWAGLKKACWYGEN